MQLKSKQLVGMLLMVYVRAELMGLVRDVQADAQGTGILGMMVWYIQSDAASGWCGLT